MTALHIPSLLSSPDVTVVCERWHKKLRLATEAAAARGLSGRKPRLEAGMAACMSTAEMQ